MSTKAAPVTTPPIVIQGPLSVRIPSNESGTFLTPEDLSPLDADLGSSDFFMAEDAPGVTPPDHLDSTQSETQSHNAQTIPTNSTATEENTGAHDTTTGTAVSDMEDISILPPLTDRDDSSLLPLSSENGDHERGNNQTLIEEHEMRRKLMDMESSFLPEPSTIDVATNGPTAGADDTYLVGVGTDGAYDDPDMTQQTESSQFSFIPPSETNPDHAAYQDQHDDTQGHIEMESAPTGREEPFANDSTLDSLASSPSAIAMLRSLNRHQPTFSEDAQDTSQFSQDERPFRSQISHSEESQLTPSKLRKSSRSLSPAPSRLFSDQSFSAGGSRRGSRPKYLTSRQSANRLSHSSITSNNTNNTDTTNSDATLGADYALQSGGAASDNWGGVHSGSRSHMTRTTSLGSMASGVSGYSEENSLERRNVGGLVDGGLQTLQEESSPQSSRHQTFEDTSAPVTPKAKPQDRPFPTDTAIAERVKGIQVPTTFAQRFREDYGNMGPSPEKRTGASTPALGRSGLGRNMTLKEQSSTIDRLSKENFDLKMRIHFLNEALNKRSEEGIKEMISENVELKSDKLKLQKDNSGLKRKIRDLEKQLKDQQSDKESMLNHDPDGSEDGDRESANETEITFLRERIETYELEVERLRSESIARESEKRRLAEMVKSLSENRSGGSETGAREERVSKQLFPMRCGCFHTNMWLSTGHVEGYA